MRNLARRSSRNPSRRERRSSALAQPPAAAQHYLHSSPTTPAAISSPYGHAVPAPNLQRLADEGILFRQAFNAAPTCSPSRASLLTGMCPHNNGMFGLAHRGFLLNDYKQHIVHTLRAAGYYSALIGVQHIARIPTIIGYDKAQIITGQSRGAGERRRAAEFLKQRAEDAVLPRRRILRRPTANSATAARTKTRASACRRRRSRHAANPPDIAAFQGQRARAR